MIAPQRVWLIDGNELWRAEAEHALRRSGMEVLAGATPMALDGQANPDLVIFGCVRPGEKETQALRRFVEKGMPVVVLASRVSENEIRDLFHAGATDASVRPTSWDKLLQLVASSMQTLFRRSRLTEKRFTVPTL